MSNCIDCPEYKRTQGYLQAALGTSLFGTDEIRALARQLENCVIASKNCPGPNETRVPVVEGRIFLRRRVYTVRTCPLTSDPINSAASWDIE